MIYLDNAATTKVKPEVINAMLPYFETHFFNPSSPYANAHIVQDNIQSCRKTILKYLNADNGNVYFTSGGSESNSWVIQGFCKAHGSAAIITSKIEHKSISETAAQSDFSFRVDVDKFGQINLWDLDRKLECAKHFGNDIFVSIQFANNEIGTIQNIKEIAKLVHKYGAILHTDATQAFGKTVIDVCDMDIDLLTASGHKIGTPKGIGFLYIKEGVKIEPIIYGSQNDGLRGGTENVPYIMGLKRAVELLPNRKELFNINLYSKRDSLVSDFITLGCRINGVSKYVLENKGLFPFIPILPNIVSATLPSNILGESVVHLLSSKGIYVSTGSACDSLTKLPSQTLSAIGLNQNKIRRTIRVSFDDNTTSEELKVFVNELKYTIERLKI